MRFTLLSTVTLAATVLAQANQPLTTNNSAQACVQFGGCTTLPASNTAVTATNYSPISSPASSPFVPTPTNAEQSSVVLGDFASSGANAAFSSRFPTGVPPSGAGSSDVPALTVDSNAILVAPSSDPTHAVSSGTGKTDAAFTYKANMAPVFAVGAVMLGAMIAL